MLRAGFGFLALLLLAAMAPANAMPAIVDLAATRALLADPATIVIDTRGDKAAFETQRLRGARWLDWERWDRKLDSDGGIVDAEWSAMLDDLGVRPNSRVLLYDDGRMGWSAMIWLALRRLGVADVHVIPTRSSVFFKQLPAAALASGPDAAAASKPAAQPAATPRRVAAASPRIIDADTVDALRRTDAPLLFDNRTRAEFDGFATSDDPASRPGHIPGALLLPRSALFDSDGEPVSGAQAIALMKAFGVEKDSPITLYCQSGGRSAAVALILWQAGFTDIAVYAGSWHEWGSAKARPVERRSGG